MVASKSFASLRLRPIVRIDQYVAFASVDLLSSVVAARSTGLGRPEMALHVLAYSSLSSLPSSFLRSTNVTR